MLSTLMVIMAIAPIGGLLLGGWLIGVSSLLLAFFGKDTPFNMAWMITLFCDT